jgi:hypothetical protein
MITDADKVRRCSTRDKARVIVDRVGRRDQQLRATYATRRQHGMRIAYLIRNANIQCIAAGVPSDHIHTGTMKIVNGSGEFTDRDNGSRKTGDPARLAPQSAPSDFGL